jgi:hypothetical protein
MPLSRIHRPDLSGKTFDAAESVLDPARILNPGDANGRLQLSFL